MWHHAAKTRHSTVSGFKVGPTTSTTPDMRTSKGNRQASGAARCAKVEADSECQGEGWPSRMVSFACTAATAVRRRLPEEKLLHINTL
ncbi:hypothetical protein R1sor_011668 [Riccia sorocarpa]|uniref:Uncharacterized protein n=1 Tax=Riccia sorocarpa TaxID=122646 RepID=A0ABD3I1J3_9MARC